MDRRSFLASLPVFSQLRWLKLADEPPSVAVFQYPYLQNVRDDRATIMWSTFDSGYGFLEYSEDGIDFQYARSVRRRTFLPSHTNLTYPFTQYQAVLNGLKSNTTYWYRASVDGESVNLGGDGFFRTAGAGPFSLLVVGDTGQATLEQFNLAARMSAESASFLLHTGDLAYFNGTYGQYQSNYFDFYRSLMSAMPVFATPGNHDYETRDGEPYLALHSFPTEYVPLADHGRYYSFNWGNAHFVSIDSAISLTAAVNNDGSMLRWLEKDLRSTRQFWRIAIMHHPPYSTGPNERDVNSYWVRTRVVPVLEAYGVQVVFCGHEHSFQRSRCIRRGQVVADGKGTTYYASGGGGANLYPVDIRNPFIAFGRSEHHYLRVEVRGTQMVIRSIRQNGTEVDRFTISPEPVLAAHDTVPISLAADLAAEPVTLFPIPGGGTLMRVTGHSLASEEISARTYPGPRSLGGSSVSVNGQALPLYYVSPDQIYAELPAGMTGRIPLRVTNTNGSADILTDIR